MYIKRDFEDIFAKTIRSRKVLVVYGSRQTGKTTVIEKLLESPDIKRGGVLVLDGDIKAHRDLLNYQSITPERVRSIVGKAKTLFIDEAQKILDNAAQAAQREHDRIIEESSTELTDLAVKAAKKFMDESVSDSYDRFLDTAEKELLNEQ